MSGDDLERKAELHLIENTLVSLSFADFLTRDFPPRESILGDWLTSQSLSMVYAYRGVGKTHFALGVAHAVAAAGSFMNWTAPRPRGVLYIDGEMPGHTLQERLARIVASSDSDTEPLLRIINPDLQQGGMPDLSSVEGRERVQEHITEDIELIIVDNVSTLTSGRENVSEDWNPVQAWALRQRAAGKSVLLIHHAGKGGNQRGTSKREDVLDTVMHLKHPSDYEASEGARFELHFEKARGLCGDAEKPLEARLHTSEDSQWWELKTVEGSRLERIVELHRLGMTQPEIAAELEINKSTVCRALGKAKKEGLVGD